MQFRIDATAPGTNARAATITTDHGEIVTPVFMPIGTCGAIKISVNQQHTTESEIFSQKRCLKIWRESKKANVLLEF